jgi:hypothetical protein
MAHMQAIESHPIPRDEALPASALSEFQIAKFRKQGFLVIDSPQVSPTEIDWCRKLLMSLMGRRVGRIEGRLFDISAREGGNDGITPQLFRPSLYATELSNWPFRRVGLAIAKQLLGPEATLSADNAVFKPARIGGTTPWHQDEAYNDPQFYQEQITIWMALYDTTPANGALAFVPGSHGLGVLPHRLNGGSKAANSIECCGKFRRETAVVCPIRAGGITIHHGRTIHGASRNLSDGPRLGYVLNYKNPPQARPELGTFPWNDAVAQHIHRRRKVWLACGGALVEMLRFVRSDRDNLQHLLRQIAKRFRWRRQI